jgi:signal transduction histidine kinase
VTDPVPLGPGALDSRGSWLARAALLGLALACAAVSYRQHPFDDGAVASLIGLLAAASLVVAPVLPVAAAAAGLVDLALNGPSTALFFAAAILTARVRRRPVLTLAVVAVVAAAASVGEGRWSVTTWWQAALVAGDNVLLPGTIGLVVRGAAARVALAGSRDAARLRALELDRQNAEMTTRLQIARAMHDGLGHKLSLIVLGLSGVDGLLGKDDERARALLNDVQTMGRDAMTELRDTVLASGSAGPVEPGADRPGPLDALATIVDRARRAGIDVTLEADPTVLLDAPTRELVERAVTEGLTNVAKHAPGARSVVRIDPGPDGVVRLEVGNDRPPAPVPVVPASGTGLSALRESVEHAGGALVAGPTGAGGYLLSVTVPHEHQNPAAGGTP